MSYALVKHNAILRFLPEIPFVIDGVRARGLSVGALAQLGVLPVVDLTPVFDPDTTRLANSRPVTVLYPDRVEVTRATEAIPAAEIAARTVRQLLQNDPRVLELQDKLRTATIAGINDYVDAQVTDLASARAMFKRILLMLALLVR